MNPASTVIALAPAVGLLWLLYALNPHGPERKGLLVTLFALGACAGIPALVLNHMVEKYTSLWAGAPEASHRMLFWVLGIGMNEEFVKLLVLLAVLYFRRGFTTPYQGLLGGAAVALGFATIENLFYLERFGTVTLLIRSGLTVPAHAFFTIPMGVCLAYAKRTGSARTMYGWLLGGLGIAMGFHGAYDIWLSLDGPWLNRMAYVQVVLMGLLALWLVRRRQPGPLPAGEQGLA